MDKNLDKIGINQKNKKKNQRCNSQARDKHPQSPQHPKSLLHKRTPRQTKTSEY
jgi:hypothetical protein